MAHMVTCQICGERFDRDKIQAVKHSAARFSHYKCEPDKELVPLPTPKEKDQDLAQLKEYIKNIYGNKVNWALVTKQIKDYHANNNYSYSGILSTLKYFYEVKKNSPSDSNGGIGIVPFVYQDAYNYYYNLYLTSKINENKNINDFKLQEKIVSIKAPRREQPPLKLWDMDWEEE